MQAIIEDFLTDIISAPDAGEIFTKSDRFFQALGFEGAVHRIEYDRKSATPSIQRFSDSLEAWGESYVKEGDDTRDPLFRYPEHVPSVFFTGAAFLDDHPYLAQRDIEVIHRAKDHDLQSGIALKMPRVNGCSGCGWNLVSRMGRRDITSLADETLAIIRLGAALSHNEMTRSMWRINGKTKPALTARESECLLWLAQGLRTDQIAFKLGIKPVTVDMHVRNAKLKLDAMTREQAVAIAILNGHIQP